MPLMRRAAHQAPVKRLEAGLQRRRPTCITPSPWARFRPKGASLAVAIRDDERLATLGEAEILQEFREQVRLSWKGRVSSQMGPICLGQCILVY
jgi:hypothetical protein